MQRPRTRFRLHLAALALLVGMAAPSAAAGQSPIAIDLNGFDALGDSGQAPDIGKIQASVLANGTNRTIIVGTWMNRSDLTEPEEAHWTLDIKTGGNAYGADVLMELWGHDGQPDSWGTFLWRDEKWTAVDLPSASLANYDGERIYWKLDLVPGAPNPRPALLRGTVTNGASFDAAPDNRYDPLVVSLQPHGLPDPLESCSYDGGCVGGAGSVDPGGVHNNPIDGHQSASAGCIAARSVLRAVNSRIAQARAAVRGARNARARRRAKARLRALGAQRAAQNHRVASACH